MLSTGVLIIRCNQFIDCHRLFDFVTRGIFFVLLFTKRGKFWQKSAVAWGDFGKSKQKQKGGKFQNSFFRYNQIDSGEDAQEEFGWKLVHGDVFRPPRKGMLLSVFLGSGTQILCMAGITLVFACLGFLSPANRGALMTCAMVLFVCLGTPAGYVSARIYKSFGGEKWKSNVLLTSMLCPG